MAQLVHCKGVYAHMAKVMDGYTPIASWDERVAIAMKETHQERHLTKDGTPLGPLCPELLRRKHALSRRPPSSANRDAHNSCARAGRGKGKENSRP